MSSAARRLDERDTRARRRAPHLSLVPVPTPARRPARGSRASAASEARARTVFWLFTVFLSAACLIGGVRVAVIVRATEMTMSESRLMNDIKEQRVEADQLEVDRSSLSTPSRIESIASKTMRMAPPRSVRYLALGGQESAGAATRASSGGASSVLDALMHMSAGEAQSLLVGDLGLAGSR